MVPLWLGWSLLGLAWTRAWYLFHTPVREVVDASLDSSNYSSYAHFTANGYQYGAEVVPMAGPYGFVLYGWVYSGELFWVRTVCELLLNAALATLTLWFFLKNRRVWMAWVWLAAHIAFTPFHEDLLLEWSLLLSGLFLIQSPPRPGRLSPATVLVTVLLAFLSLIKGTQLMLGFATLAVTLGRPRLAAALVARRQARRGLRRRVAGVVAGRPEKPLHLPAYLADMLELARGYNAAMAFEEPAAVFLRGAAVSGALLAALGWALWARRTEPMTIAGLLLVAGHAFAQWKHGLRPGRRPRLHLFSFAIVAALAVQLIAWLPRPGETGGVRADRELRPAADGRRPEQPPAARTKLPDLAARRPGCVRGSSRIWPSCARCRRPARHSNNSSQPSARCSRCP